MDIYNKSQLEIAFLEFEREMKQEYNEILRNKGSMINTSNNLSSVNMPDYSAFGIAANTPGVSLAEAQALNDILGKY